MASYTNAESADVLIIGAGVFGASTAFHLCNSSPSSKITLIDRTPAPAKHAASTDVNKIIRADYTSQFYMNLAYEAMQAWATWPQLKPYYHRTGWISLGEVGSDIGQRIRENFRQRGHDPTSDLPLAQLRRSFGGIYSYTDLQGIDCAYWNPEAGWCDAASATAEVVKSSVQRGVNYVVADVKKLVRSHDGGLSGVETSDGAVFRAHKVVLASGAWTSSIMTKLEDELDMGEGDRFEQQARAAGVCVAHYEMHPTELSLLKEMPVTIYGDHGDAQPPPKNHLLKFTNGHSFTNTVTTRSGHRISAPPGQDQTLVPEKLQGETWDVIAGKVMPQFTAGPVAYWRLCWDAVTPSQDHLITRHPDPRLGNLFLAIGGSFHSYKFLPTIGRYVVNVLNGVSNGAEKDEHWAWKRGGGSGRGAHEKAYPQRELREFGGG